MTESRVERRERERREEAQRLRRRERGREPERKRGREPDWGYEDEPEWEPRGKPEPERKRRREPEREQGREPDRSPGRAPRGMSERQYERELERELKIVKERRKQRRRIGGVIALIVILLAAFTVFRAWLESRPGGAEPIIEAGYGEFADINRVNILFLGTNQGLTDTIVVFSYDMGNNKMDAVSIPRDTYYYRSGYPGAAYQKINSVYETEGYEGACKAASDVLGGIPIHYYAVLEPEGTKKIVDAMGGVVMDIPMDMHYVDVDQNLYIDLRAGSQLLNGDQAMQYLRFRSGYANGDIGRVSAQQEFLKAVISQSAGLDFPKVALAARSEVKTNMSMTAAAGFAAKASGIKSGSFTTQTIPGTAGMKDGLSYYFHDADGTKALMRTIYAAP